MRGLFAPLQEDSFHLVDTRPTQRNRGGPRRFGPNRFQQAQRQREAEAAAAAESKHRQPRKKQQARMVHQYQRSDQRVCGLGSHGCCGGPAGICSSAAVQLHNSTLSVHLVCRSLVHGACAGYWTTCLQFLCSVAASMPLLSSLPVRWGEMTAVGRSPVLPGTPGRRVRLLMATSAVRTVVYA